MTKAELIAAMKDFPDDGKVYIWCGFDHRDPAGSYKIKRIFSPYETKNWIYIQPEDD